MRQRIIKTILFVIASGAVLVGYQNCAKVKDLQTLDSPSRLGGTEGTGGGGFTSGGGSEGGSTPAPGGGGSTGGSEGGSGGGGGSTSGGGSEGGSSPSTPRQQAYARCNEARTYATNVTEYLDIMNFVGNRTIRLKNLGIVSNYTGNLTVVGAGEKNNARIVKDSNGNFTFCNMDVSALSNLKNANVMVVGGDVENVTGFTGNLTIYGGRITGAVSNVVGNIYEEP